VRQQAPAVDLDSEPTWWLWTVSRVVEGGGLGEVATGSERTFRYTFTEPGEYKVSLVAGNCVGSSEESTTLTVVESPIEDFVVGAAVKVSGANDTRWETDLRFHNPCGEPLGVRIEFEPEARINSGANLVFREFELAADQTRIFADITEAIPGLVGEELSGSVRIASTSASGCKVLSVSRTYNSTPEGTLGLFVPALPVKRAENELLDLTGLVRNAAYRSNLRLVNYGDEDVWVPLRAFDRFGEPISSVREAQVPGHSTKQLNDVAGWLGVSGELAPFSVRAEVEGLQLQAFATVVDNHTGDSVLFMSSFSGDNRVWVAGVASTAGVNDSYWRTDLWLYNPTDDWLLGELDFVVGTKPTEVYGFTWPDMKAQRVRDYLDVVGEELNLEETSGYLVLTGKDGGPAPQVAARTYNLALDGGTFGLGLRTFTADDLLRTGETAYIVGVSNSADPGLGFRTNLALLNTDENFWLGVRLTLIELSGAVIGEPLELMIAPGVLRQFDVADRFGVAGLTGSASLKVEVTGGGGLAAYATEIDNRTQDSIFIPAQRKVMGAPQ
jgi:PKD repeat protein